MEQNRKLESLANEKRVLIDQINSMEKKIQREMIELMKGVHLNSSTIEALMDHLYDLNKKLLMREGKLLRLANDCGIKREDFMLSYNLLAIQRHMKVLGIFCRLSLRDNKDQYLQHLPRVKKMLYENLKKEKFEKFNSLLSPLLNHVRYK